MTKMTRMIKTKKTMMKMRMMTKMMTKMQMIKITMMTKMMMMKKMINKSNQRKFLKLLEKVHLNLPLKRLLLQRKNAKRVVINLQVNLLLLANHPRKLHLLRKEKERKNSFDWIKNMKYFVKIDYLE